MSHNENSVGKGVSSIFKRQTDAWVPAPPRPGLVFAQRLGWSALAVALGLAIAGYASQTFWSALFAGLYSHNQALSADAQALKPLTNITMYAIPTLFYAGGVGAFGVGVAGLLVHDVGQWVDNWRAQRRGLPSCD
ncbi:hypothetical protein [Cedecea sp.]|jgi:hypothetical protein|uniref:hypothetical protein n=1 Tax=Cedecea sp. TaxID=1970739 RepID=UPI002F3F717E